MKKFLIFIALLVLIAGCTTERKPTFDANNGIIINEFTAEPTPAKAGDQVSFFVDIENVGGTTASNVLVSLFGVENVWEKDGSLITTTQTVSFPEMRPPSLSTNRAGDFKVASFFLMPSTILPQGVMTNFPVTARVTFDYSSTSTITIPAFSDTLFTVKKNKGEAIDIQPRVDNSHAPVQIRVTKATVPLVIDEKRAGDEIVTFVFEFVDVGAGAPVTDNVIGRMRGTVDVAGPGVSFSDCLGVTSGTSIVIDDNKVNLVKLRSDRRVPFGCSIKIDRSKWTSTMSGSVLFRVDMQYKYFVEKSVEVPVIGTGERARLGAGCECTYSQNCEGPNNCNGVQTCSGISSQGVCVYDQTGRCAPACTTCSCEGVTPPPAGDACEQARNALCSLSSEWCSASCDQIKDKVCNKDCSLFVGNDPIRIGLCGTSQCPVTPPSAGKVPCVYNDGVKECAGTNPHCSSDQDTVCNTQGCGYNPQRFDYGNPDASNYACSKSDGLIVCEYSEPTQGICLGTDPRCDTNDCSQTSAGCGYNPKRFNYDVLNKEEYDCRPA